MTRDMRFETQEFGWVLENGKLVAVVIRAEWL